MNNVGLKLDFESAEISFEVVGKGVTVFMKRNPFNLQGGTVIINEIELIGIDRRSDMMVSSIEIKCCGSHMEDHLFGYHNAKRCTCNSNFMKEVVRRWDGELGNLHSQFIEERLGSAPRLDELMSSRGFDQGSEARIEETRWRDKEIYNSFIAAIANSRRELEEENLGMDIATLEDIEEVVAKLVAEDDAS